MKTIKHFNILKPKSTESKKLMILFHGVGSFGDDLMPIAQALQTHFIDMCFIAPDGCDNYDLGTYGYQWFSLKDKDHYKMMLNLQESLPEIAKFVENKLAEYSLKHSDLFLLGFSQGTMVALSIAFYLQNPIAGIIGYSGALLDPIKKDFTVKTPICLIHGDADEVLNIDCMYQTATLLTERYNANVEIHAMKGLKHSIDMKGVEHAIQFLKKTQSSC